MSSNTAPTENTARIASLDVLRGVALLGILTMNIGSFSMPGAAYFDPTAYGDLSSINGWIWKAIHLLADQKFMAIFSMLFGAGIVLICERCDSKGQSPIGIHYRRMGWLIIFGMLHAHLLWYGDVLYWYGVCGLVLFLFRRLSPNWLILWGILLLAVTSILMLVAGSSLDHWPTIELIRLIDTLKPSATLINAEIAAYQGDWFTQLNQRTPNALEMQTTTFLSWAVWRVSGLMLIGMALFKLNVFSAQRSQTFYVRLVAISFTIGIPLTLAGIHYNETNNWQAPGFFFFGTQFNYWGSIPLGLGWVGIIMLLCKSNRFSSLKKRFAAIGQTAFSNYILQTVICTTIFYGHGLGLFGQLERLEQMGIVVLVWIIQLILSPLWLQSFRFGPLEWLWRSLVYRSAQPFRRR